MLRARERFRSISPAAADDGADHGTGPMCVIRMKHRYPEGSEYFGNSKAIMSTAIITKPFERCSSPFSGQPPQIFLLAT
jgi:hypothetical protein